MNGRTINEIAERTKRGRWVLTDVLRDEVALGHVAVEGDRFALTPEFEERFGFFLRCFEPPEKDS